MPKPKSVLFIGRVQPIHNGHEVVIRKLVKQHGSITIGIGSANEQGLMRNPFSFKQRKRMLQSALADIVDRIKIIPINDKHNDKAWREHVLSLGKFTHFATDNEWVRRCLKESLKEAKYPGVVERDQLQATRVREELASGREWERRVNPKVAEYLKRSSAPDRLRRIKAAHPHQLLKRRKR